MKHVCWTDEVSYERSSQASKDCGGGGGGVVL
jgi:hypothetical protein